ncbi:MAG: hypothetical protein ACYC7A_21430 [Thermoanaerobaculia bacterium]
MIRRFIPLAALLLCVSMSASAARREYRILLDGERKAGSEVCFFGSNSTKDAFGLYFSYQKVACLPADSVLDFPPGIFHAFARHPEGYVSAARDYFVFGEDALPEEGYELLDTPLHAAALADFGSIVAHLGPGESVGAWIGQSPTTSGTFFPLVEGESILMVPASIPFIPMRVKSGMPVALGEPLTLRAGELKRVAIQAPRDGESDVIVWLRSDASSGALPATVPDVTLAVGEAEFTPATPLHHADSKTLVIFKHVPVGAARLQLRGKGWRHADETLTVVHGTTTRREPLVLRAGADVAFAWGSLQSKRQDSVCSSVKAERALVSISLARCPSAAETDCQPVAGKKAPYGPAGAIAFQGLEPGRYRAVVSPPFAKPKMDSFELPPGADETRQVTIDALRFFGTVKLNGRPFAARIIFYSGEAESDASGLYDAALASDPLTNHVRVTACDDGRMFTYVPLEGGPSAGQPFDIDIRVDRLTVAVEDQAGKPVPRAFVRFSPVFKASDGTIVSRYSTEPVPTDVDGTVVLDDVPTHMSAVVCATHHDHPDNCTEPLTPKQLQTGKATIRLQAPHEGIVIGHTGHGFLSWVSAGGQTTERVRVQMDGTFAYSLAHAPSEHLIYVSNKRALAVLPLPANDQGESLTVRLPEAPIQAFEVLVPGATKAGFVGLWVGGMYVPLEALALHHDARGIDIAFQPGKRVQFRDISATGTLQVAFAPEMDAAPGSGFVDPFTLPEFAACKRYAVRGATVEVEP